MYILYKYNLKVHCVGLILPYIMILVCKYKSIYIYVDNQCPFRAVQTPVPRQLSSSELLLGQQPGGNSATAVVGNFYLVI